ncbi:MAG TPA: VTT domain-containing protein [Pyrinomonadaceae bacterium]|jgi:membrane protein YqaA with SNARE-associated domain|nr:VTT domain-containing protein [Pyrinomonadaceae bacterium]
MFDWLAELVRWLHDFIREVPIYVAAPAMILIGTLDSSLLSLPEINDYLVVARCYSDPKSVFYFPLFAAFGSVLGCLLLYTIMRRGGQAVMRRRFRAENIARVERAYARYGFLAIAVPAILPPPMPFKIFVATAGALEYPRWRFILTVLIARSLRYLVEGALAVFYGERVLVFMRVNGLAILSIVAAILILCVAAYVLVKHIKTPRSMREMVAEKKEREKDQGEGESAASPTDSR